MWSSHTPTTFNSQRMLESLIALITAGVIVTLGVRVGEMRAVQSNSTFANTTVPLSDAAIPIPEPAFVFVPPVEDPVASAAPSAEPAPGPTFASDSEKCRAPLGAGTEPLSSDDIEEVWLEYTTTTKFCFGNAAFWLVLWAFCLALSPFYAKLEGKRELLRKLTGDKLMRTRSMRRWFVNETRGYHAGPYFDPFPTGEVPVKLSKHLQPGRLDQCLSRMVLSYGSRAGFTYALYIALLSMVIGCAFIRRHVHVETVKPGYQVFWEFVWHEAETAPWRFLQYMAMKVFWENPVAFITGCVGAAAGGVGVTWKLVDHTHDFNERLLAVERRVSDAPSRPPPPLQEALMAWMRSGQNSSASASGATTKRLKSIASLDSFAGARTDASFGIGMRQSIVRDPTYRDFSLVKRKESLPPLGPSMRRSPSVIPPPSAPPAYDDGDA